MRKINFKIISVFLFFISIITSSYSVPTKMSKIRKISPKKVVDTPKKVPKKTIDVTKKVSEEETRVGEEIELVIKETKDVETRLLKVREELAQPKKKVFGARRVELENQQKQLEAELKKKKEEQEKLETSAIARGFTRFKQEFEKQPMKFIGGAGALIGAGSLAMGAAKLAVPDEEEEEEIEEGVVEEVPPEEGMAEEAEELILEEQVPEVLPVIEEIEVEKKEAPPEPTEVVSPEPKVAKPVAKMPPEKVQALINSANVQKVKNIFIRIFKNLPPVVKKSLDDAWLARSQNLQVVYTFESKPMPDLGIESEKIKLVIEYDFTAKSAKARFFSEKIGSVDIPLEELLGEAKAQEEK